MRFFIISLCINLVLLVIPLKGFYIEPKKQDNVKVVLNEVVPPLQENIQAPQEIEEVKEEIKEEIKEEVVKEEIKTKEVVKKEVIKKPIKKPVKKQTANETSKPTNDIKENTNIVKKEISEFKIDDNFCKSNVLIGEIDDSYPKKAKMLKKLGAYEVKVRFKVLSSGIKVLDIYGDKLFVEHTQKLFKNLNYKIKDKRTSECIFVKVIKYEFS